jgi:tRNA(fMet)-specific endonuclease VapC
VYLLDTNTLIYFFKGKGSVADNLLSRYPQEIGIPVIVLYELEVGVAKSTAPKKRLHQLEEFISLVRVIDFTEKEAKTSAGIRANLEKRGKSIGPMDVLIGGTALANGATLVTHNTREFQKISGLKMEDWY